MWLHSSSCWGAARGRGPGGPASAEWSSYTYRGCDGGVTPCFTRTSARERRPG
ncbi:hypothetical protein CU044_3288 [Streptomyces sp. L-9-10]|nr:hypothetical protein CU044_3288 [Streptomyces sp. L-9-10]